MASPFKGASVRACLRAAALALAVLLALSPVVIALCVAPARAEWVGVASFYGSESGTLRADGKRFRPGEFGAAHWTLPLGTRVRVTDLATGRTVVVPVNDRGPHPRLGRLIDLSAGAARALGITRRGLARVRVERL